MTASLPPDGPSRDLRERLIRALYVATWDETFEDWADSSEIEIAFTGGQVDAILAEITRSGHVIVAAERYERMERVVTNARAYCRGLGQYGDLVAAVNTLRPGDLDPVEPGAGR